MICYKQINFLDEIANYPDKVKENLFILEEFVVISWDILGNLKFQGSRRRVLSDVSWKVNELRVNSQTGSRNPQIHKNVLQLKSDLNFYPI
jgi:hypothetical protein